MPPILFVSQPSLAEFQTKAASVGYILVIVTVVGPVTFNGTASVHVSPSGSIYIPVYQLCRDTSRYIN